MPKNLRWANHMPFLIQRCLLARVVAVMIPARPLQGSRAEIVIIHLLQAVYLRATLVFLPVSIGWMTVSISVTNLTSVTLNLYFAAEVSGTHHHSLQQKHASGLTGESDSPDAASPYSRTPALRASHKMAERKRRTEMKYLFDGLRAQIPASQGSKSSKWEILSKGKVQA